MDFTEQISQKKTRVFIGDWWWFTLIVPQKWFNFWKLISWGFLAYNNHSHHEAAGCGNEGPVAGNRTLHGKLAGCRTGDVDSGWAKSEW